MHIQSMDEKENNGEGERERSLSLDPDDRVNPNFPTPKSPTPYTLLTNPAKPNDITLVSLAKLYQIYYNPSLNTPMTERPKEIFDFFPPVENMPQMQESLKMINTVNAFPPNLSENIEIPSFVHTPEMDEDSFAERCSFQQPATGSAKKRRVGCNCKKTFCLKMYCECYSSSRRCGEDCACISCKNVQNDEEGEQLVKKVGKHLGKRKSGHGEKGCHCKKTRCLKRYCECYNSGVGCSQACKCEGCENKEQKEPPPESVQQIHEAQSSEKKESPPQPQEEKINFTDFNLYNSANDMDKFFI